MEILYSEKKRTRKTTESAVTVHSVSIVEKLPLSLKLSLKERFCQEYLLDKESDDDLCRKINGQQPIDYKQGI